MTTATKQVSVPITRSKSDGSGTFEGLIHPFEVDLDHERVENFVGLPTRIPLVYQHLVHPGEYIADPSAQIGTAKITHQKAENRLRVEGKFDLSNPMAQAIYERMLLPRDDPHALNEFSIGFTYDPALTYKGKESERILVDVELREVSIVWRGAQRTELVSIKSAREREFPLLDENGERYMLAASGEWILYESGRMIFLDGTVDPGAKSASSVDDDLRDALDELEFGAKSALESDDVSADVQALIDDVRREVAQERADRERFLASNQVLLEGAKPPGFSALEGERDRERQERELAEIARRDAEKAEEAAQRDLADEARRLANWHTAGGGFVDWKAEGETVPRDDDGQTFRLPVGGSR
jgi:hypothetical protein